MMTQIQLTRGQQDPAHTLLQQASRLMDTKPSYPSPSTPSGDAVKGEGGGEGGEILYLRQVLNALLEAAYVQEGEEENNTHHSILPLYFTGSHTSHCISLRQSISQAETHLHQQNTSKALRICKQAISSASHISTTSPEVSHILGRLHLITGVALVQDLEERRPKIADKLWKNHLQSIPDSVMKFLSHFLTAYQLCFPLGPSLLLRDTCQWLCVCLSSTHVELAHHFFSQSIQVSLSHQAVYAMGKKWRCVCCVCVCVVCVCVGVCGCGCAHVCVSTLGDEHQFRCLGNIILVLTLHCKTSSTPSHLHLLPAPPLLSSLPAPSSSHPLPPLPSHTPKISLPPSPTVGQSVTYALLRPHPPANDTTSY